MLRNGFMIATLTLLLVQVDVTIIAEIYQDLQKKEVLETGSLVITCAKLDEDASFQGCFSYEPPRWNDNRRNKLF